LLIGSFVTTAWRVLGLWLPETSADVEDTANVQNIKRMIDNKGQSSSLGVGRGNDPSP